MELTYRIVCIRWHSYRPRLQWNTCSCSDDCQKLVIKCALAAHTVVCCTSANGKAGAFPRMSRVTSYLSVKPVKDMGEGGMEWGRGKTGQGGDRMGAGRLWEWVNPAAMTHIRSYPLLQEQPSHSLSLLELAPVKFLVLVWGYLLWSGRLMQGKGYLNPLSSWASESVPWTWYSTHVFGEVTPEGGEEG